MMPPGPATHARTHARTHLDLQRLGVRVVLEDELLQVEEGPLVVHALPDLFR